MVSKKTTILEGIGGTIRLDVVQSNNWTQCYLLTDEGERFLGAEKLSYLVNHLLSLFEEGEVRCVDEIEGREGVWVLSLSEAHHSFYAAKTDSAITLFIQDAKAVFIGAIELPVDQCAQWKQKLEELGNSA